MITILYRGTASPKRWSIPPITGPTSPAELSMASSIPNSPPICDRSARLEQAEAMDVFMMPSATITAAITAYTRASEDTVMANTRPRDNATIHTSNTFVGSYSFQIIFEEWVRHSAKRETKNKRKKEREGREEKRGLRTMKWLDKFTSPAFLMNHLAKTPWDRAYQRPTHPMKYAWSLWSNSNLLFKEIYQTFWREETGERREWEGVVELLSVLWSDSEE